MVLMLELLVQGHFAVTPPYILGHEAAGIICESDNENYPVGEKIVINPLVDYVVLVISVHIT